MRDAAVAEILGVHMAESEPSAELWHRVALGELSGDEAAAQLLAGRQDVSEQERAQIEHARRAFAPLSKEQQQERLAALLARRAEEEAAEARRTTKGEAEASPKEETKIVQLSSQRSRRWAVALLAAAAAVALTVWLVPPRSRVDGDATFVAQYGIELDHDVLDTRGVGPEPAVPTFLLAGKIVIRLVPKSAVQEPIGVVMFVNDPRGRARRLAVEPRLSDRGVAELATTVEALGLEEGEQQLVIAIGRTDALPSSWEELVEAERVGPVGFEVVRKKIRVVRSL